MEISQLLNPADETYSGKRSRATSRSEYNASLPWSLQAESSRQRVNYSPHQNSSPRVAHKMISPPPSRGRSSVSHRYSNDFQPPFSPSIPFTDSPTFEAKDLPIHGLSLDTAPSTVSEADTGMMASSLASESTMNLPSGFNKCGFDPECQLQSEDRKVVSHFFGRNKSCTRRIPDELFAAFCRKHYQRSRYRKVKPFGVVQMDLVELTLARMKKSGGITGFEVALKLSAKRDLEAWVSYEKECQEAHDNGESLPPPPSNRAASVEKTLIEEHLGKNRSFEQVAALVKIVRDYVEETSQLPPQFELLPSFKDGFGKLGTITKKKSKSKLKPIATTTRSSGVKKHLRTPPISPNVSRPTRSSLKSDLDLDEDCRLEAPVPKRRLVQGKHLNRR